MKEKMISIVEEVTKNASLSEGEQVLEVATRLMHLARIPQHEETIGRICDELTQLGVVITGGRDPEKLAPEQLADIVEQ